MVDETSNSPDDGHEYPWVNYLAQTLVVLALVLAFQWSARGELTLPVALVAAGGYLAMVVAVARYRRR